MKPILGWGSFGRPLIHNSDGQILTIPDGRWVITIGALGWVGYVAEFGLLAFPILLILFKGRQYPTLYRSSLTSGLSLIVAVNMFDMLPNATLTPLTWLMAGSLLGYMQAPFVRQRQTIAAQTA